MNQESPLRSSRVVLTAATIIGCVLLLFSTLTFLKSDSARLDERQANSVNVQLQSEFEEFYPANERSVRSVVENRVRPGIPEDQFADLYSFDSDAASQHELSSKSRSVYRTASTFGQFQSSATPAAADSESFSPTTASPTTSSLATSSATSTGSAKEVSSVPSVSVPVTINVNNGELLSELIEMRERLNELRAGLTHVNPSLINTPNVVNTPNAVNTRSPGTTQDKYSYKFFSGRTVSEVASQDGTSDDRKENEPTLPTKVTPVGSSAEVAQTSSDATFEASLSESSSRVPQHSSQRPSKAQASSRMPQVRKHRQSESSTHQRDSESVSESGDSAAEFPDETPESIEIPSIIPINHQFVTDAVEETTNRQDDEVTFVISQPAPSEKKAVPAPEEMPQNLPEFPELESNQAAADNPEVVFSDRLDTHLSRIEKLQNAGVFMSPERLRRIEAFHSLRHLPPEDLLGEATFSVVGSDGAADQENQIAESEVPQLPVMMVTQSIDNELLPDQFSVQEPSTDVPAIPRESDEQHPELDISLLAPGDSGIVSGAPLNLESTPGDVVPLPPDARFEVAAEIPERNASSEVQRKDDSQFSMNAPYYQQSETQLPALHSSDGGANEDVRISRANAARLGNQANASQAGNGNSRQAAVVSPSPSVSKPKASNSLMSTTFRRMKKRVAQVTGPVDLPDFKLPTLDRPDFEWSDLQTPDIDLPSFRVPRPPKSQLAKTPAAAPEPESAATPAPRIYVPQLYTVEARSPECLCEFDDDEPISFGNSETVHRVMSTLRFAGKGKTLK